MCDYIPSNTGILGPVYLKMMSFFIKIMIYIFRGHVKAYMKDNEMLFQIIYGLWVWFHCYTGEGIKIHRK